MNRKVLLLDGSGASFPVRMALETLGYQVSSIGANPNQFQARMGDMHHHVNYGDCDQLVAVMREKKYDLAVPGCTDLSFQSYASLDQTYRCLEQHTILCLNTLLNKAELGVSLSRLHLKSLDITLDEVLSGTVKESIVVKPADAFSGRGITVLQANQWMPDKLEASLALARSISSDHCALIQRYLEGDLFSLSLFSDGLRTLVSPIVKEYVSSDHRVVSSHLAGKEVGQIESVERLINTVNGFLGRAHWFLHVQFLLDPETKDVYVIDCAARCPGDYYGVLVEMASEFPYFTSYATVFTGGKLPIVRGSQPDESLVRKTFHEYDAAYPSGVDFSTHDMLAFYPDLAWSNGLNSRVGVGFFRV